MSKGIAAITNRVTWSAAEYCSRPFWSAKDPCRHAGEHGETLVAYPETDFCRSHAPRNDDEPWPVTTGDDWCG